MGNRLDKASNELKEGGNVRYEIGNPDGEHPLIIEGVYKEVKGKEKLV